MLLSIQSQFRNGLAIGIGVGLLSGFVSASFTKKDKLLQADHILEKIKDAFLLEGPIEGSWIEHTMQPYQKFAVKTKGYPGGITRYEDDQLVTYKFLVDAKTGAILELNRM